jgi:hypothetical protein
LKVTATNCNLAFLINLAEVRKIARFWQTAKAREGVFQEMRTIARQSNEIKGCRDFYDLPRQRFTD